MLRSDLGEPMNFDFSEDQKLLQKTARDFLESNAPLALCRSVLESNETYSSSLWKGAAEMGWLGAVVPEEYGGAGFGHLELSLLAYEVGRALAPIPMSSSVYLATEAILLAGDASQRERLLPPLADGSTIGTYAVAERRGPVTPGAIETRFENGRVSGAKVPVADAQAAQLAVIAANEAQGLSLVVAHLDHPSVTRISLPCIDGSRDQGRIEFSGTPAERIGAPGAGAELLAQIQHRAAVLVAFEQLGGAERAFELTREFCMQRYAFGRPIASFQALKHRMADMYCALELARSNAYYGAWALHHDAPELAEAACVARISATEAMHLATTEMIQLYGGVGYTWEYDCHLFYRRSQWLGLLLGSLPQWRERLVQALEAS